MEGPAGWTFCEARASTTGTYRLARDVNSGRWVVERTTGPWHQVGSLLPAGFAAYARISTAAYRRVGERECAGEDAKPVRSLDGSIGWNKEVPWAEVAAADGRVARSGDGSGDDYRLERYLHGDYQPGLWDEELIEGSLPVASSHRLDLGLDAHDHAELCCRDLGWARSHRGSREAASSIMPTAQWCCSGPDHAGRSSGERSSERTVVRDRPWCVATDVDRMTTYVGASEDCVHDLITTDELEAMPIVSTSPRRGTRHDHRDHGTR